MAKGKDQEIKPGVTPGALARADRTELRRLLRAEGLTFEDAEPRKGAGSDVKRVLRAAMAWWDTDECDALSYRHAETLAFGEYWEMYDEQA
jgi:hypothetical protein